MPVIRRIVFAVALVCFAWGAHAATVVQTALSTQADPAVATFSSPVSSGNAVVLLIGAVTTITSITDDQAGSYTQDYENLGDTAWRRTFASRLNVTDGPDTVTIDAGNSNIRFWALEVSGLDSFDVGAAGTSGLPATTTPTASLTPGEDNNFGVCIVLNNGGHAYTPGAAWTSAGGTTFGFFYDEDMGAIGTKTCDPTVSSSTNYASIASYTASAGGGATAPKFSHHQLYRTQ